MLRLSLALALLACAAPAQLTVHPNQNLQAAVDAVPDGGYVLIFGGTYQAPIWIENKSVALLGAAPWTIRASTGYPGYSHFWPGSYPGAQQEWGIEARGRSDNWLVVHNARISGRCQGFVNRSGGPMRVEGYGILWVADSIIEGFDARDENVRAAEPGINYYAPGGFLLVERSIVIGGIPSSFTHWMSTSLPPGGAGILAPGSTVQMNIALVRGGQGDYFLIESGLGAEPTWRPTLAPCPCVSLRGAEGGPAVVSSLLFHPELAILEGGRGAAVLLFIYANSGTLYVPWGYMQNGPMWARV